MNYLLNKMITFLDSGLNLLITAMVITVVIAGPVYAIKHGFSVEGIDDKAVVKKILIQSGTRLLVILVLVVFGLGMTLSFSPTLASALQDEPVALEK